jgi:hypothetical protein
MVCRLPHRSAQGIELDFDQAAVVIIIEGRPYTPSCTARASTFAPAPTSPGGYCQPDKFSWGNQLPNLIASVVGLFSMSKTGDAQSRHSLVTRI